MSNIFGSDDSTDATEAEETAAATIDAGLDTLEGDTSVADDGASTMWDLLAESGVDTVWLDLDGDMIPETAVSADGPFAVDDLDATYDDWTVAESYEFDTADGSLVGQDMSVLLPYDVSGGSIDPFAMSETDWCECGVYDPMTAPTDWTVEGYADFTDPYAVPGMDEAFTDAGAYYDLPADTSGYWDTSSYYESAGGYLDTATTYDTWDLPMTTPGAGFDTGMSYDTGVGMDTGAGFDTGMGYDTTSSWDPTAGDAQHDAFISTITEDYSDPTSSWDSSTAMEQSQAWNDVYESADALEWDAWNASVDAYVAGDDMASYEYNQLSIDAGSMADDAWNYSNDAWSDTSYTDTSYTDTSYTDTSYTDTSYTDTSY